MKVQLIQAILLQAIYLIPFYLGNKLGQIFRLLQGGDAFDRLIAVIANLGFIRQQPLLSFHIQDLLVGLLFAGAMKSMTFAGIDEGASPQQPWPPPSKAFVYDPATSVTFGNYQQDLILTFGRKMEAGMYHIEISFDMAACQSISLNYYYTP